MAETVLTLEEVKAIVGDSDIPFEKLQEMMSSNYNVTISEDLNPGKFAEGSEERSNAINNLSVVIFDGLKNLSVKKAEESKETREEKKSQRRKEKAKKKAEPVLDAEGNQLDIPSMTRTTFIEMLIKEAGNIGITSKEIMAKVDEAYHYTVQNRSPRTRVLKTLRTLSDSNKIVKKESGEIVWVG